MCKTPAGIMSPSSAFRHRKRAIEGTTIDSRRPAKRVSFSKCDKVLGTAQDYDRTSFEMPQQLRRRRVASYTPPSSQHKQQSSDDGDDDSQQKQQNANFCGMWRRSHGFNWASLLLFSGVDKEAIDDQAAKMQSSSVVHLIDHDATSFRLAVHSDSGGTQDQHFFIGGQPRPNSSASSTMLSSMRWAKGGQALELSSIDAATGDEMTVSRHLASQGSVLVQHYTARRAKTGETAEAITIFRKVVRGGSGGGSDSSSSGSSRPN